MLANQNLMIESMQMTHKNTESVLELLSKACEKMSLVDVGAECQQVRESMKDTESMFTTLKDASTADLSQVLQDVKKFATDAVSKESRDMESTIKKGSEAASADLNDKFKKLESRVLSELAGAGGAGEAEGGAGRKGGDAQILKKVATRMSDFESQVSSQLQVMSADIEKKLAYINSQKGGGGGGGGGGPGVDGLAHDLDAVKYDLGELKDIVNGNKNDTAQVKRVVLACERDMEDFTAAMDAVNVDLDEMRARVDSTHSIITSRQRVEATVTAEISTMRLDMGDMQEALKAHDAWMEDVSQSLQEAHERCHQLSEDIAEVRDQTQHKLDQKVDVAAWNEANDDHEESVKTVRDMASALRLESDTRRRKVDEALNQIRSEAQQLEDKVQANCDKLQKQHDNHGQSSEARFLESLEKIRTLEARATKHEEVHQEVQNKIDRNAQEAESMMRKSEAELAKQDEELNKGNQDRMDSLERHYANVAKETAKRLNALDLRLSGLQGSSGELKRDSGKLRDEVNNLTVKSAAHDVDIGKCSDDLRKLERQRAEDSQRHKQDMDGVYEELDQKVYEKNFKSLEDLTTKLTRGTVKLCQVVGVFPGARVNDGSEEELDVDVELLNWEDCAQHLTARVEKTWRQLSSQKYRSILDLVSKKADHSVLRLLQISQQHIESQLDRVRHERELWKEVVDKRAQQPMQLALSLKDPATGQPLPPGAGMMGGQGMNPMIGYGPRFDGSDGLPPVPMGGTAPMADQSGAMIKGASPLAKRIARPAGTPPQKA